MILSTPVQHQVINVALPRAEEVAVVVVRVAGIRAVVTVVTTSVIPVTSVQAASMAGNRDKVVNSRTSTLYNKSFDLILREFSQYYVRIPSWP